MEKRFTQFPEGNRVPVKREKSWEKEAVAKVRSKDFLDRMNTEKDELKEFAIKMTPGEQAELNKDLKESASAGDFLSERIDEAKDLSEEPEVMKSLDITREGEDSDGVKKEGTVASEEARMEELRKEARPVFDEMVKSHIEPFSENEKKSVFEAMAGMGVKVFSMLAFMMIIWMLFPEKAEAKGGDFGKIASSLFGGENISPEIAAYQLEGEAMRNPDLAMVMRTCSRDNKEACKAQANFAIDKFENRYDTSSHKHIDMAKALKSDGDITPSEAVKIVDKENKRKKKESKRVKKDQKSKIKEIEKKREKEKRAAEKAREKREKERVDWNSPEELRDYDDIFEDRYGKPATIAVTPDSDKYPDLRVKFKVYSDEKIYGSEGDKKVVTVMIVENKKDGSKMEVIRADESTDVWRDMNLGYTITEGGAHKEDGVVVLYSEKGGYKRKRGSKHDEKAQLSIVKFFGEQYGKGISKMSPESFFGGN